MLFVRDENIKIRFIPLFLTLKKTKNKNIFFFFFKEFHIDRILFTGDGNSDSWCTLLMSVLCTDVVLFIIMKIGGLRLKFLRFVFIYKKSDTPICILLII